jgi:hypothetical protein
LLLLEAIFEMVSANVQTFQTGASAVGNVSFGDLGEVFAGAWGVFGCIGTIN